MKISPKISYFQSVAGNIATASPISDLNPIWMAANAKVNPRQKRWMSLARYYRNMKDTSPSRDNLDKAFFLNTTFSRYIKGLGLIKTFKRTLGYSGIGRARSTTSFHWWKVLHWIQKDNHRARWDHSGCLCPFDWKSRQAFISFSRTWF